MAKGMFAGSTDYSHQTLDDIKSDIKSEVENLNYFIEKIKENIEFLEDNDYWNSNVPNNFKWFISYCLKAYDTARIDFSDILNDIDYEVKEHHCIRLNKISTVADEINRDIGRLWHQDYNEKYKDYGNSNFTKVENIYAITRDIAVNLLDFDNLAVRLRDYIGQSKKQMKKNNPWISGTFYLFVSIIVFTGLAVLSNMLSWYALPIVIIGSILIVGIIGALQLKNDDKISDKSFVNLMIATYKKLPLLNNKK